jgi:hypothetical protein
MSQRNIELHDRLVEAVNAREVPEDLLAPGFRMENRVSAVTDYAYHGTVGWSNWVDDVLEVFADGARYEAEEIVEAGDDFVVAILRFVGVGARLDTPIVFRWVGVTWFRNGKATHAVGYPNRREALEAAHRGDSGMSAGSGRA